ncbi:MAG: LCP family protein [Spirochaetaceae bacterium]
MALLVVSLSGALVYFGGSRFVRLRSQVTDLERRIAAVEGESADPRAGETASTADADTGFLRRFTSSLDSVLEAHNRAAASRLFETLLSAADEELADEDGGFSIDRLDSEDPEDSPEASLSRGDVEFFSLRSKPVGGAVAIRSADNGRFLLTAEEEVPEATEFLLRRKREIERLIDERGKMADTLTQLFSDSEVAGTLDRRKLEPGRLTTQRFQAHTTLQDTRGSVILSLAADAEEGVYFVNGQATEGTALHEALRSAVEEYDPAEERDRILDSLSEELEKAMSVGGLDSYLEAREIRLGKDEREEGRLIRSVFHQEKEIARLIMSSSEGTVALKDLSGGTIETLLRERPASVAGDRPSAGTTFLLIGTNGGLADAIMLVNVTPTTLAALSIPRDIYLEERKLSEWHLFAGTEGFAEKVGDLVGVSVDHYVTMSMTGFEEVIDDLDSIDVELEEEILDPSMIYESDGEQRMLFFPSGEHEVGPEAVMALVRSRATTSDYSRSQRQRAVVAALRRELASLSAADTQKVFALFESVARNAKTDLSLGRLMSYYRQFRGAAAIREHGLSEDNVLRATYSNVHEEGGSLEEYRRENGEELGAWILVPKEGDWDLLRWYAESWLAGRAPSVEEYLGWDSALPTIPVEEGDARSLEFSSHSDREEMTGPD